MTREKLAIEPGQIWRTIQDGFFDRSFSGFIVIICTYYVESVRGAAHFMNHRVKLLVGGMVKDISSETLRIIAEPCSRSQAATDDTYRALVPLARRRRT